VPGHPGAAVVEHRRHRGRLAGAGGADHDHQAALGHHDIFQHFGQAQVFQLRNRGINGTQHHAHGAHLHEGRDAEAPQVTRADREVRFLALLEHRSLLIVHDRTRQVGGVGGRQRLGRHGRHFAVDLDGGREAGGDEEVRAFLADHQAQQVEHEF